MDSVPVSDKALLFGRKVTAPSTSMPALAITTMCWHTDTRTWLQVKHAPKLGTYRLDHVGLARLAPPA